MSNHLTHPAPGIPPGTARPVWTFKDKGIVFELDRPWIDVYGAHWEWTGLDTESGEPLMQCDTDPPLPLSEGYTTYGPWIPAPRQATPAEKLTAIETPQDQPAPVVAKPAEAPTPSMFAALLRRLRGRS
ncbi:hypothetical protein AMK26_10545 [Streptomyces sp. CB03234]|uniref:phiSA1p31-related protein n=1 Tax=Streptomyces sp. (strain CB03234) TaxID=1703937 RepID=UPI00095F57E3|nr:phiSA1p31-related protein [Streptomyces sp. CB03234]OKK06447.1 hypothetical protein AMK26_10545 [Streptomyces sp. CB03234]